MEIEVGDWFYTPETEESYEAWEQLIDRKPNGFVSVNSFIYESEDNVMKFGNYVVPQGAAFEDSRSITSSDYSKLIKLLFESKEYDQEGKELKNTRIV